jgi:hypothetical protein
MGTDTREATKAEVAALLYLDENAHARPGRVEFIWDAVTVGGCSVAEYVVESIGALGESLWLREVVADASDHAGPRQAAVRGRRETGGVKAIGPARASSVLAHRHGGRR